MSLVVMLAFTAAAASSTCGFYGTVAAYTSVGHKQLLRGVDLQCSAAAVSVAVCTGSSCESRCNFNSVRAFEGLASKDDAEKIDIAEIRCMNMCKRGPAVRIVSNDAVATVEKRMNEQEVKRTAFQNVASLQRVEAIYAVAQAINDGSLRDAYGEFTVTQHGPLPPSAM